MGSGPRSSGMMSISVYRRPPERIGAERQKSIGTWEIDNSYKNYVNKSEITELQGKTIAKRRDAILKILQEDFAIRESHLIGSFTRGTMVGPLNRDSDADVMVVLDTKEHRNWIEQENGAKKAEEYEGNGNTESAVVEWKKIFGDYFPSYG